MGIHPVPNRYLSPFLAFGLGVNTGTGFDTPVLVAGAGLETTLLSRFVVALAGEVYYPTPGRISDFIKRMLSRGEVFSAKDFLTPSVFRLQLGVTYFF